METVTTTIYLVYRPPSSADMDGLVKIIQQSGPNTIMVGDFNLPSIDWEHGTAAGRAQEFLAAAEEKFMEQLVTFPTQVKGNTLDLVLTNAGELIESVAAEGRLGKSDHEMISIQLSGGKQVPVAAIQKPDWGKANWEGIRTELAGIDWYTSLENENTESAWNIIKECIEKLTSKYVPARKIRPPNRPMWMTREISRAMDKKRRLWRRRAPAEEYKEAEKKVRNLVRNAKRNFEKKLAQKNGNCLHLPTWLK